MQELCRALAERRQRCFPPPGIGLFARNSGQGRRFPESARKFPDRPPTFPAAARKFPVRRLRELALRTGGISGVLASPIGRNRAEIPKTPAFSRPSANLTAGSAP